MCARRFAALQADRQSTGRSSELAAVLSAASPGRQEPLWDRLNQLQAPTLFVAGAEDAKFVAIAYKMAAKLDTPAATNQHETTPNSHTESARTEGTRTGHSQEGPAELPTVERQPVGRLIGDGDSNGKSVKVEVITSCGHAVHVERPEALVPLLRRLIFGSV